MKTKPKETILLAAQEISFAKALASNDKSLRDRALRKLKKWLFSKSQKSAGFTEEGFMRIWKGLFYCVWMSDKPLVQEECIEAISNLIHCFRDSPDAMKFVRCFFQTMSHGWFGLDGHRMDKYLMLVRRFLRQTFEYASKLDWEDEMVEELSKALSTSFYMTPLGLTLHLADIYMEELAKIGRGELKPETTSELLKPFVEVMSRTSDNRLLLQITNNVFFYLLRQSEEGVKHAVKFQAWKQLGFPGGDIDLLEEVEPESEEELEMDIEESHQTALDARAGNVDVELPPINFDARHIADYLESLKKDKEISTKFRKQISHIISKYRQYSSGKYPLGTHKYEVVGQEDPNEVIEEAAEKLYQFEEASIDSHKRNKKRLKSNDWEVSLIEESCETSDTPAANGSWEITDLPLEKVKKSQPSNEKSPNLDPSPSNLGKKKKKKRKLPPVEKVELKKNKQNEASPNSSVSEWGDCSWDFSSEKQTEIVVQSKRNKSAQKSPKTPNSSKIITTNVTSLNGLTPSSEKKVEFVLNKNMSQREKDYVKTVKKRPSIPYDAEKKPTQGVLKPAPYKSPINPFYKMKSKR